MPQQVRVTVQLDNIIGTVDDRLYGANIEHIGQTVYGGSWAEMVHNRKFTGHDVMYTTPSEGLSKLNPEFGVVLPWSAVNPDEEKVLFVHDHSSAYTGLQSQRITIFESDGEPHGIQQQGLYLEAGRSYDMRIVLKGEGQSVAVQLGESVWNIPTIESEWMTYTHILTATETIPNSTLQITTTEKGSVWIGCISVMPSDNLDGHRKDVVEVMRDWQPTFLRWPGGNIVSAEYHWWDGIGDRDKRNPYFDYAWAVFEPHDVGTDEFMKLCQLVGSEPVLTVNMGAGTIEEAAAWVEYCNGDTATKYGALRAANGHPEPYKVHTWFVGNEQFGNWQIGHSDAETYAHQYLKFVAAMRAVDPTIDVIAVGVPVNLYGRWNEYVLKIASEQMDMLSVHYYSIRTERYKDKPTTEELYEAKGSCSPRSRDYVGCYLGRRRRKCNYTCSNRL